MMRCIALLTVALIACGCSTSIPVENGRALVGAASCRAASASVCNRLSGRTLYNRRGAEVSYFAPDGTLYSLRGTRVDRATWSISGDGQRLLIPGGVTGFGAVGVPIAAYLGTGVSISGDPIGLASRDTVAAPLRAYDTRPFPAIAAELRG